MAQCFLTLLMTVSVATLSDTALHNHVVATPTHGVSTTASAWHLVLPTLTRSAYAKKSVLRRKKEKNTSNRGSMPWPLRHTHTLPKVLAAQQCVCVCAVHDLTPNCQSVCVWCSSKQWWCCCLRVSCSTDLLCHAKQHAIESLFQLWGNRHGDSTNRGGPELGIRTSYVGGRYGLNAGFFVM